MVFRSGKEVLRHDGYWYTKVEYRAESDGLSLLLCVFRELVVDDVVVVLKASAVSQSALAVRKRYSSRRTRQ